jgi:hypothetical protein
MSGAVPGSALYPRRTGLIETIGFALGVELVALGSLAGSGGAVRAGASALVGAARLATAGAAVTRIRRYPSSAAR